MTENDWFTEWSAQELLRQFGGRLNRRKLRLFAVQCCRVVENVLTDTRSRQALAVAERFADGLATRDELRKARTAANDVWHEIQWGDRDDGSDDTADAADVACQCVDRNAEVAAYMSADLAVAFVRQRTGDDQHGLIQATWLRDILGNPFRPVALASYWRTSSATALARTMYDARDFAAMPILADALEEAGCDQPDLLAHCRDASLTHVRGCWAVDLVLGKS